MGEVRVGIVGLGFFGRMHAEVLSEIPGVEVIAVADPDEAVKRAPSEQWAVYDDYRALLERKDIDAVHICVPDRQHVHVVKAAIEADKHIFVEKPLADSAASARELCELACGYPKKLMVGYILRFNPASVVAYETIQRGDIGRVIYVSSRRVSPVSGGRKYGPVSNLAIHSCVHDIDLARWLVGSEYSTVYSRSRAVRLAEEGIDSDDVLLSIFEFENGVVYSQENCWVLPVAYPVYVDGCMQVVGTKGAVNIDFFSHGVQIYDDEGVSNPDLQHWPLLMGHRRGDLREEIAHFIDAIINDEPVRVTCTDGLAATWTAECVLLSCGQKRIIDVVYSS